MLEPEEQLGTLQLLIYLLPPCNCDTLHRLLQFLSIVARHAEDNVSKDGQEVRPPTAATHARLFLFPVLKGRAKKEKGGFPGGSAVKNPPAKAGNVGSIPGSGRSPGGGRGKPRRYSCLENPTDTGAWQATVHAVAQSWTRQGD